MKVANNTYRTTDDATGATVYRFHETDIATVYPDGTTVLSIGEYTTATTKDRLNRIGSGDLGAHEGCPFSVYQAGKVWHVTTRCGTFQWGPKACDLHDLRISPTGEVQLCAGLGWFDITPVEVAR